VDGRQTKSKNCSFGDNFSLPNIIAENIHGTDSETDLHSTLARRILKTRYLRRVRLFALFVRNNLNTIPRQRTCFWEMTRANFVFASNQFRSDLRSRMVSLYVIHDTLRSITTCVSKKPFKRADVISRQCSSIVYKYSMLPHHEKHTIQLTDFFAKHIL